MELEGTVISFLLSCAWSLVACFVVCLLGEAARVRLRRTAFAPLPCSFQADGMNSVLRSRHARYGMSGPRLNNRGFGPHAVFGAVKTGRFLPGESARPSRIGPARCGPGISILCRKVMYPSARPGRQARGCRGLKRRRGMCLLARRRDLRPALPLPRKARFRRHLPLGYAHGGRDANREAAMGPDVEVLGAVPQFVIRAKGVSESPVEERFLAGIAGVHRERLAAPGDHPDADLALRKASIVAWGMGRCVKRNSISTTVSIRQG